MRDTTNQQPFIKEGVEGWPEEGISISERNKIAKKEKKKLKVRFRDIKSKSK